MAFVKIDIKNNMIQYHSVSITEDDPILLDENFNYSFDSEEIIDPNEVKYVLNSSITISYDEYKNYVKYINSLSKNCKKNIVKFFNTYTDNLQIKNQSKLECSLLIPEIIIYLHNNHGLDLSIIPDHVINKIKENRIKSARK